MRKLLIATRNKNKFKEIKLELSSLPFEIISLDDVGQIPKDFNVKEDGKTFEENAVKKAREYGQRSGLLTLADDSGLCVDALNGEPGVYSQRWVNGSSKDRNKALLEKLKYVPKEKRIARYVCVIAVFDPEKQKTDVIEEKCEGLITLDPVGDNGFSYDPIFFSLDLHKTFGQATIEEKNSVSHRGKALKRVIQLLALLEMIQIAVIDL